MSLNHKFYKKNFIIFGGLGLDNQLIRGGYTGLDFLKICMAYLVVLRHCGQSYFEMDSLYFLAITNCLSTIAVPMFFVISGFLFFRKEASRERLAKQVKRIFRLYSVWTIIYLPLIIRNMVNNDELNIRGVLKFFQTLLFDGSYYHLWFLPSLVFALCMIVIMRKMLGSRLTVGIALILFIVGVLGDSYLQIFKSSIGIFYAGYRKLFLTTRNGFFCGSLFVAIGSLLADYEGGISKIKNKLVLVYGILVSLSLLGGESILLQTLIGPHINNMLFATIPVVVLLFLLFMRSGDMDTSNIRQMSTLVYTAHPIIIVVIRIAGLFGPLLRTFLTALILSTGTVCCIKIMNRVNILKYLL